MGASRNVLESDFQGHAFLSAFPRDEDDDERHCELPLLLMTGEWGRYIDPEFQKWFLAQLERQKCKFEDYDLPDAYADWLESKKHITVTEVTKNETSRL